MAHVHIGIAGNIGVGKSTLADFFMQSGFGMPTAVFKEAIQRNPYLPFFYQDQKRWAFESQMSFLQQRLYNQTAIRTWNGIAVEDRTAMEDRWVFAEALHDQGMMPDLAYENYLFWYNIATAHISVPHIMVYLRCPDITILLKRICKRDRKIEAGIDPAYLRALHEKYETFIRHYHALIATHFPAPRTSELLVIDATPDLDENPDFLEEIRQKILQIIQQREMV